MFLNCLFLLLFVNFIDADYGSRFSRYSSVRCPMPDNDYILTHKQRGKFVMFSCVRGYTMMGNKYATCKNRQWDVPLPICINFSPEYYPRIPEVCLEIMLKVRDEYLQHVTQKSGCEPLEEVSNAVNQTYHTGAWVVFFCLPRHNLIGSSVLFCDGQHWNSTAPKCIDSLSLSKTSCDFEQNLCGWKQDETHDFDWRRINTKTPSSFMNTGPSYDHTLGKNGNGYYMYIESTSRYVNDSARLISPVYDKSRINNSCFVFYYHMFGRHIGGLRVYQKPDRITMQDLLRLTKTGKNNYTLFEKWGNQGDVWFASVSSLLDVDDDFQIVIEGIRGSGFISDIAIDDVAIMQGGNCTKLIVEPAPAPPIDYSLDSCVGRCGDSTTGSCICDAYSCLANSSCCPDYLEVCVFDNVSDDYTSQTPELPQTQKLIATPKTTYSTTTIIYSTPRTSITTQTTSTTTQTTPTTTQSTSTTTSTTASTTTSTTKRFVPTTPRTPKTTLRKPSTRRWTTRPTTRRVKPTTTKLTTTTTTPIPTVASTKRAPIISTTLSPTKRVMFTATVKSPGRYTPSPHTLINLKPKGTNGAVTAVIVLFILGACCGLLYGGYYLRSSRGSEALARLRGRTTRDSEVRFLKSDVDDIDDE